MGVQARQRAYQERRQATERRRKMTRLEGLALSALRSAATNRRSVDRLERDRERGSDEPPLSG